MHAYLDEISDQYHAHDTKIVIRSQDLPFCDRNDPCLSDIHCFMGRAFRSVMDEAHVSTGRVAERTNLRDPFFLPRMLEDTLDNTCASDVHRFPPSTACFCSLLFTKTPQCSLWSVTHTPHQLPWLQEVHPVAIQVTDVADFPNGPMEPITRATSPAMASCSERPHPLERVFQGGAHRHPRQDLLSLRRRHAP